MISIYLKPIKFLIPRILAILLAFPGISLAQESVSFTVSPTIFDMTANPGQTWRSTIRVINTNSFDLPITVEVANFAPKGESGAPQFFPVTPDTPANSTFAQWITTDKEIVIPAEKAIELPLTINVPADAAPGGHFAAIMISTKPANEPGKETKVQTSQVISSLVFLRVSGDVTENSSVRSFRTTDYFLSQPETTFELRIENKGNVHVQPRGEIKILNMWGQERGKIPVNQQTLFGNVLPNSVRKYSFTWSGDWSITDIGRYTAKATLSYGVDGKQSMVADTAFWVIPWKILFTVFAVIGGFIALVSWAIKAYVRRMLTLAGVAPGSSPTIVTQAPKTIKQTKILPLEPKGVAITKTKSLRLTAPIEAGMLDLRSRLKNTSTLTSSMETILMFVRHYWKFFSAALAVVIFIGLFVWFLMGAFTPSRDFEVTIEEEGRSVKVSGSEQPEIKPAQTETMPQASSTTIPVSIINRSGDESMTRRVQEKLQKASFTVAKTSNEFDSIEQKTVIVYNPADAETALSLSKVLNNALLSSYVDSEKSTREIIIYLGVDAIKGD